MSSIQQVLRIRKVAQEIREVPISKGAEAWQELYYEHSVVKNRNTHTSAT